MSDGIILNLCLTKVTMNLKMYLSTYFAITADVDQNAIIQACPQSSLTYT